MARRNRGDALYHNVMSYAGGLIMVIGILLLVFFLLVQVTLSEPSPYIGIIAFMVLPGIFVAGLVAFLWGMRRESLRRRRAEAKGEPYPRVDLNDPRHRRIFARLLVAGSVVGVLLLYTSYRAYEYTESVEFCGTTCHSVMAPEYTAYLNGPHARVPCVECHVGKGVDWYVKSKLSGLGQVFAVTFNTYEKPIEVPIRNLRPARETCEECHWPNKFFGAQLIQNPHFRYDEENTAEQISLLVKTGGGSPDVGPEAGIHWHMMINNEVWFKPADRQQQSIPWVRVRRADGTEAVYTTDDADLEALEKVEPVRMDCMHCHNRPSHVYPPPDAAVDVALLDRAIPRDLPWIKLVGVEALTGDYDTRPEAHAGIRDEVESFYADKGLLESRRADVDQAVERLLAIYDRSVFPEMRVDWQTYPNNIGHRNWPGCARCHDGRHSNSEGGVLSRDCTVCHTMPVRSELMPLGAAIPESDRPWHPLELTGKHDQILCSQCHEAGYRAPIACAECHGLPEDAPMMAMGCDTCHMETGSVQPMVACGDCHEPAGLHEVETHTGAGCTTCHAPHAWAVTGRDTCLGCHDGMADHNAPTACAECHAFGGCPKTNGGPGAAGSAGAAAWGGGRP